MNLLMNMLSYLKKRLYKAVDKSCYGDHKTSASRVEDLFTFPAGTGSCYLASLFVKKNDEEIFQSEKLETHQREIC